MIETAELIAFEPDLLFLSRIEGAAGRAQVKLKTISNLEELLREAKPTTPRVVFLNLDAIEANLAFLEELAKNASCKIIGYYSHVNTRLAEEARRIGISTVLSRGAFVSRLEEILKESCSG